MGLFSSCDPENFTVLLGAVQEVKCSVPIDGEEKCVKTCEPGDVFGELALMYNCPRAASVEADTEGTCWKLDRETFNAIVRDAAQKKREKWEAFLKKVQFWKRWTTTSEVNLPMLSKRSPLKMAKS